MTTKTTPKKRLFGRLVPLLIGALSLLTIGMVGPASAGSTHLADSSVKCYYMSYGTHCEQISMTQKNTSYCDALRADLNAHPSFRGFAFIGGVTTWIASVPVVLSYEYGFKGAAYGAQCIDYDAKSCLTSARFSYCQPN